MPLPGELAFLHTIQSMALFSPVTLATAFFAARYLIFVDILLLIVLVVRNKKDRHIAAEALWAGGVAIFLTTIISCFIKRPRPFSLVENGIQHLVPIPFNMSFPSGHTSVSLAVALILLAYDRRLGAIAFIVFILVAFGRMAVGVHYPTDILGGVVVGGLAYLLVKKMHREMWTRRIPV